MTLYTGSITGGGAASFIAKVEECLAAESANWEFVEEYVFTKTYRIWKNKGHAWSNNVPFYIALHASDTTTVNVRGYEEWDPVTKKFAGPTPSAVSGNLTLDSLGRIASSDPISSTTGAFIIDTLPTSDVTYAYYISVAPQGIQLGASTNIYVGGYVGLFEPSGVFTSGEFPLVVVRDAASAVHRFSRVPGLTGSIVYSTFDGTITSDTAGAIPTGIAQLGGKSILSRRKLKQGAILRGFLPSWLLVSNTPAAGVVTGDTITINGVTYTYTKFYSDIWIGFS